jgi:PAS domain S-box-containing protein
MGTRSTNDRPRGRKLNQAQLMRGTTVNRDFLSGGGECGRLMRAIDWSQSPLGSPELWPQSLKTAVRIILTSRQPMFVWWGEQLINLYNDPYRAIAGDKHPAALGKPASEVWHEVWDQVGPRARKAMRDNVGTYDEALLLVMERHGYPEETYYTFSYSPIPGDSGATEGIICANTEDTGRIVGERQLATLKELAARIGVARSASRACVLAAKALVVNDRDIPFAMLYLVDPGRKGLKLESTVGISRQHPAVPEFVDGEKDTSWPFAKAITSGKQQVIHDLRQRFEGLPKGGWDIDPCSGVIVPFGRRGREGLAGVLVVGLNPYRQYSDNYESFIKLVANEISAGIVNAEAYATERQRAESLAELDRAKTNFFSNVSHEFRTPLTLILGPLEEILHSGQRPSDEESEAQLELVYSNGLRLQKLVNTLLDFSRIEAERVQALFMPTDAATLTADLASNFRSAIEKAGLTLSVKVGVVKDIAYLDREMWEKIVLNLLSNAFKYTLRGGIEVSLKQHGKHLELKVKDSGTGIRAKDLPKLFERFHRIQGADARTHEGTGIGLSLVQELVKQHGGAIDVDSTYGEGTTFTVSIPLGFEHLPQEHVTQDTKPLSTTQEELYVNEAMRWLKKTDSFRKDSHDTPPADKPLQKAKLLLADDNQDMREYVYRLLQPHYDVRVVADGQEALDAIHADTPDILLTDGMMPRLDGFELVKALRADTRTNTIPIIMLSARAGEDARIEGVDAGADDYLTKPFAARELLARVNANMEMARIRREAIAQVSAERQQLEESERRFRFMAEAMPQKIFTVLPEGRISYFNPQWEDYSGIKVQDLIDDSSFLQKMVHPDDIVPIVGLWKTAFNKPHQVEHDFRLLNRKGEYRWHFGRMRPMKNEAGDVIVWIDYRHPRHALGNRATPRA